MKGTDYILAKQVEWAKNQGIELIGSQGARGRLAYTQELKDNLFQPLLPEVRTSFEAGDGSELGTSRAPGKMQAVHSSSALGVNVFQYWKSISQVPVIAAACGLCKKGSEVSIDIKFEEKFPIDERFRFSPNIDAVILNKSSTQFKAFGVECKFSEAYGGHKHGGLKEAYLELDNIWSDIPALRKFAKKISPEDSKFRHLHPAQLIKHVLGLKRKYGLNGFRLLYLWYDVPGEEGTVHRDEITKFTAVAKSDGVRFHSITYQELIAKLARELRSDHDDYIKYMTSRYL